MSKARRITAEAKAADDPGRTAAVQEVTEIAEQLAELNPHIKIDAKEFGLHVRHGGWRLGLLVARSVESGVGSGGSVHGWTLGGKISQRAFARQAKGGDKAGSPTTVGRYLQAWDLAAADPTMGIAAASELGPGQPFEFDDEIHTPEQWAGFFKKPKPARDRTVQQFFAGLDRYDDAAMREWIRPESFRGQSDFRPQDIYDVLRNRHRSLTLGMELFQGVMDALDLETRDD